MKPREIFEVCHARYKGLRAYLGGHMAAIDLESPSDGYHGVPTAPAPKNSSRISR